MTITLSKGEVNHILHLIEVNEREGWYYGNKEQYEGRARTIKEKLTIKLKEK